MSTRFVIEVMHTGLTTAAWGESLDAEEPIANMVAMIAISSVVYNLLIKINSKHGLIACVEGACWMVGSIPIFYWLITKGRALPSIDNYRYLGLILVIAAICLGFVRSRLKRLSANASFSVPPSLSTTETEADAILTVDAVSDPPLRKRGNRGRWSNTRARRWILVAAAAAIVAVSAAVPMSFPLRTSEASAEPRGSCQDWYNARVVPIFENQAEQWIGWANALHSFADEPERREQLVSDIDIGKAPAELLNLRETGDNWFVAQDNFEAEFEITVLDDRWDDDEMKRVADASTVQMRALIDLMALQSLLADSVGFPPFPDAQGFTADLGSAALGLEKACALETATP